jgi:hypothetical protein
MALTKVSTSVSSVGAQNGVFYLNNQTITSNYTVPANQNAMSAGPLTIATGVVVTISDGATWTIV